MSTSLREGLSRTGNIETVAETTALLFDESATTFDGGGPLAARAGRTFDTGDESNTIVALESHSQPVGALEITQRTMTSDATMRRVIATIMSPATALYIDGGTRMGMMHHLSMGPADGVRINTFEAQEAHAMFETLGLAESCIYIPFASWFRSVVEGINHVSTMIERFEKLSGYAVSCMLEGDSMVGWCSTTDSSGSAVVFGRHYMDMPAVLGGDGIYVIHSRMVLDAVTLVDRFTVLRDTANYEPVYGRIVSTVSTPVDHFAVPSDTGKVMRMLVMQTIGLEVAVSPLLLDTLCACFSNLDGRTDACERLGIRR